MVDGVQDSVLPVPIGMGVTSGRTKAVHCVTGWVPLVSVTAAVRGTGSSKRYVWPLVGEVMRTCGGGNFCETVAVTALVTVAPAPSVAVTVKVRTPVEWKVKTGEQPLAVPSPGTLLVHTMLPQGTCRNG